ncbi:MAG: hypothetical protein Q8S73_38460 [Deltaproteobacteria bacterium]|nr:hypothetical protein [Myxococcales bacterium]MDP3220047.1 hypothetical protein [Deltaproteobacteria bacterium]
MNLPANGWMFDRYDPDAACPIPGCDGTSARWNVRLPEALRPLCARCRQDVHTHRARHPELFVDEAVAAIVALAERRALAAACRCPVCGAAAARVRPGTASELVSLCTAHRQAAQLLLARERATRATAVARLVTLRDLRAAGARIPRPRRAAASSRPVPFDSSDGAARCGHRAGGLHAID